MLLLLRRFKHDLFMNNRLHSYLGYAIGELALVICGILIALQIDNWNEDRKERAMLRGYLESIARNMQEDLVELAPLRDQRLETLFAITRFEQSIQAQETFSVDEVFFFNQVQTLTGSEIFLSANTSGFEVLKSSGVLDRLQGSGLEHLLYAYYDVVNQITLLEDGLYDKVRPMLVELRRDHPAELPAWTIELPNAAPPDLFQDLQPHYRQLISSPMVSGLVDVHARQANTLMRLYDSMQLLGQAFIRSVEDPDPATVPGRPRTPMDDFKDGIGFPQLVGAGRPALEAYWLSGLTPIHTSAFRHDSIRMLSDEIFIDYPGGAEWASVSWSTISETRLGRAHADFSRFSKLVLELKGARGGEVLSVHVKDADYPDDISPASVDITLRDEWQTYEIDLAEFAPNDFTRLHIALGLLIFPAQDPLAFSIREAFYQ